MKYGKRLRDEVERTFPDWSGEFISYKQLKKQLNLTDPNKRALKRPYKRPRITIADILDAGRFNVNFSLLLNHELEKVNRFYVDKEEDYIIRLKVWFISLFSPSKIVVLLHSFVGLCSMVAGLQLAGTAKQRIEFGM